jgi:hypothetical protein
MREMTQEECLDVHGGVSLWKAVWGGIGGGIWGALIAIPTGPMGMLIAAGYGAAEGFAYGLAATGACETAALAGQHCPGDLY